MGPLKSYPLHFVFFLLILCSCNELSEYDNERIQEALSDSLVTSSTTWNLNMEIMEDGFRKLSLKSSKAVTIRYDDEKRTQLSGPVQIQVFEADTLSTEVFADSALYIPKEAEFELFENVKVFSRNGKQLFADHLLWNRNGDKVTTPGYVLIITETDSIAATGFEGTTTLTEYTLKKVTGKTQFN